ncbi:gamma-glutamylcyclotransferase family protein [Meiothermus granaticius]|uniref:Gamma-glutamyl cyclotransferase, AIG2-like n=1 Tax=Meiothermus granaticius NBRC 107808 TaxID=1227551 RepID=A0A399FDI1_9DEIN|nr:gamma-glutamylcyclotransferase family protein [Meiothermus granaticius]RIH93856.1 Gamma-glutamyl cyclotransferase, AIG2-like [Meiothermus granaticius NBRC 107808]GEM86352.1 gamma-glutamylcyclotransferase [Meiothermus granaticius NBRC 107808]
MQPPPVAVFVYGTLQRGERNFAVSQRAGWLRSERAWVQGFQLFHLPPQEHRPYGYPALVEGEGVVWGEVQWFSDLPAALQLLDELEEEGREYRRIEATALLPGGLEPHGFEPVREVRVWVYAYPDRAAIAQARGVPVPDGLWSEADVWAVE